MMSPHLNVFGTVAALTLTLLGSAVMAAQTAPAPAVLAQYRDLSGGAVIVLANVPDSAACEWLKQLPREEAGIAQFVASNRAKGLVAARRGGETPTVDALLAGIVSEYRNIGSHEDMIVRGGTEVSLVQSWLAEVRNAADLAVVVKLVDSGRRGGLLSVSVGPKLCGGSPVTLNVVWGHVRTVTARPRPPEVRLTMRVGTGTLVTDGAPDPAWADQLKKAETEADLFQLVKANQERGIISVEKLLRVEGLVHNVRTRYVR